MLLYQEIVIGTPGRLRDLIEMGVCRLDEVSFVVSCSSLVRNYEIAPFRLGYLLPRVLVKVVRFSHF